MWLWDTVIPGTVAALCAQEEINLGTLWEWEQKHKSLDP